MLILVSPTTKEALAEANLVDENRARVVASNSLHSINFQLQDTSLLSFTIPVLYNICVDYGMSL